MTRKELMEDLLKSQRRLVKLAETEKGETKAFLRGQAQACMLIRWQLEEEENEKAPWED